MNLRSILQPFSVQKVIEKITLNDFDKIIEDDIIKATFLLNEELKISLGDLLKDKNCILTFLSTFNPNTVIIVWKTKDQDEFYKLKFNNNDSDVQELCENFIFDELKKSKSGILHRDSFTNYFYAIEDIGTSDGYNLLFLSVINNCNKDVKNLCKHIIKQIDEKYEMDDENGRKMEFSAIDKAWYTFINTTDETIKNASNEIILSLLNANSKFPEKFDEAKASKEVKEFVDHCENLHKLIDQKNLELLEAEIEKYPHLWYFYDKNNQSLMARVLKSADLQTFKRLSSLELSIGEHELNDYKSLYKQLEDRLEDREEIRDENQKNSLCLQSAHVYALLSKCKIANYNRQHHIYQWKIVEAFQMIDSELGYPQASKSKNGRTKVLKIAAASKKIKIYFDFDHDTNYYFDPVTSIDRQGTAYTNGDIVIGAKELLNENTKFEVIGTLIHELTHVVVSIIFMNGFNPYQMGESDEKKRFNNEVRVECENNRDIEELIDVVFENYEEKQLNLELIVRPYHMMIKYINNNDKLNECREKYLKLFEYLEEVVEGKMDATLEIWKKLQDDQIVMFNKLTEPMKAKILHSKIYFQRAKTTLINIIDNNSSILELLDTLKIKEILFDENDFKIGDETKPSKYNFIERRFKRFKFLENGKTSQQNYLKFASIKKIVNDSKNFILTGKAGDGKSTVFKSICKHLKKDYIFKNYWVSCLELNKNKKFIKNFQDSNPDMKIDKVSKLICKIVIPRCHRNNFETNFEAQVFQNLFKNGKSILLFDGIDEISPDLNEFAVKVLKLIQQDTKNQIWISTRPQYATQIKNVLNADLYTLEPYNFRDRNNMIKNIATSHNIKSSITSIQNFFKNKFQNIFNPFLIEIITENYESNKNLIDTNIGKVFENIIYAQYEKMEPKIDPKDKVIFRNFNILFQTLALKFMFDDEKIKNLSIIKNWEDEKKSWTCESINRFGYAEVMSDFLENGDNNSIDFMHYLYAEYFVAVYINENIFDKNIRDEEFSDIFRLLKGIYLIGPSILMSLVSETLKIKDKKLPEKIKNLILTEIEEILNKPPKHNLEELKYWTSFLHNDDLRELRDKNFKMSTADVIDKANVLRVDKRVIKILPYILNEWGENYYIKLKNYLKDFGIELKDSKKSFIPNEKWFKKNKDEYFIKSLAKYVAIYLEQIFKKYKSNTSLKILREKHNFPSISIFELYGGNFKNLISGNLKQLNFFNVVNIKFLALQKNDRNMENYKKIINNVLMFRSVNKKFLEKINEKEFFDEICKHSFFVSNNNNLGGKNSIKTKNKRDLKIKSKEQNNKRVGDGENKDDDVDDNNNNNNINDVNVDDLRNFFQFIVDIISKPPLFLNIPRSCTTKQEFPLRPIKINDRHKKFKNYKGRKF